ncbi:MAG TPA: hypothetical protein VG847_06445 [Chitinophagaceae bacterium]|nr:hypothetical protein [Chitinophagaceae bacterium]
MHTAGYSGTPLAKKLGLKEGFVIRLINPPPHYRELFHGFPPGIKIITDDKTKVDCIHCFVVRAKDLSDQIRSLHAQLKPSGFIWVSWYKKSSKIKTDVTEDFIRSLALKNGLVDIKVCAVDDLWSGLKLVIPVKERSKI